MARVKLGEVARESKETIENARALPTVGLEHLTPGVLELERWENDAETTFSKGFKKDQILFGRRRAYLKKAAVAPFDGVCSGDITVIEAIPNKIDKRLLPFVVQNDAFFDFAMSRSAGGLSPRVKWKDLQEYEFNLPPIEEQARIADLLWAMNDAKKAYRKLLAATDELVKARFVEMFGDPILNPKHYKLRPLKEIAEYWNGLTYKPTDVSEDGTIVLRSSNIQNTSLDFSDIVRVNCRTSDKKYVNENDILMCSRNGSASLVGKVALISNQEERMTFGAFMMIIRSAYYSYLMTYFQLPAFRRQIVTGATTTIKQITNKMLDEILIPLPEEGDIKEYTKFIAQVNKNRIILKRTIEQAEVLNRSLLRRYCR